MIFGIHHLRDQIRGEVCEFIHPKELITPRPLLCQRNSPGFPGVKEPLLLVGGTVGLHQEHRMPHTGYIGSHGFALNHFTGMWRTFKRRGCCRRGSNDGGANPTHLV